MMKNGIYSHAKYWNESKPQFSLIDECQLSPLKKKLNAARRQEIIKMTEQLIEAINNGDFDAYT